MPPFHTRHVGRCRAQELRREEAGTSLVSRTDMDDIQELRIEEVMTPAPVCLEEGCTFAAALTFFVRHEYQSAPVLDRAGRLVGTLTRAGLLACLSRLGARGDDPVTLRQVLQSPIDAALEPAIRVSPGMRLKEAARLLAREQEAGAALVLRHGELLGILTLQDVARAMGGGAHAGAEGRASLDPPARRGGGDPEQQLLALLLSQQP